MLVFNVADDIIDHSFCSFIFFNFTFLVFKGDQQMQNTFKQTGVNKGRINTTSFDQHIIAIVILTTKFTFSIIFFSKFDKLILKRKKSLENFH